MLFSQNSPYEKNFEKRMYSNTQFQKIVLDGYVVYRPKINLHADRSVLKYDEIKLSEAEFLLLSRAFFDEIEVKYV